MHLMEIHFPVGAGILWINSSVLERIQVQLQYPGQPDCSLWFFHVILDKWLTDCIWCLLPLSKENIIYRPVLGQWEDRDVRYSVFLQPTKRSNGFGDVHVWLYVHFHFSFWYYLYFKFFFLIFFTPHRHQWVKQTSWCFRGSPASLTEFLCPFRGYHCGPTLAFQVMCRLQ